MVSSSIRPKGRNPKLPLTLKG